MAVTFDEFRVSRIISRLIRLTESNVPEEKCMENLKRFCNQASGWRRFPSEKTIQILIRSSNDPDRFNIILEKLQTKKINILGPYLLLLSMLKYEELNNQMSSTVIYDASSEEGTPRSRSREYGSPEVSINKVYEKLLIKATEIHKSRSTPKSLAPSKELSLTPRYSVERRRSLDFIDSEDFIPDDPIYTEGILAQEKQLIEDLLSCFMGFHGTYISANPLKNHYDRRTFSISEVVEQKLRGKVEQILPIAAHYSILARFVEENRKLQAGKVNQVLSYEIGNLLHNFGELVVEIEAEHNQNSMDLNKLRYNLQEHSSALKTVAELVSAINSAGARGGQTLSVMHEKAVNFIADKEAQELTVDLTQLSSVPYFESVSKWIYSGVLYDPYDEFMVVPNKNFDSPDPREHPDDYWRNKYQIRGQYVPSFLQTVTKYILDSGKCLEVVQAIVAVNEPLPFIREKPLYYDFRELRYLDDVKDAYEHANAVLLDMMLNECDLIGRLRSFKSYFFMEKGDLFVNLMDICGEELERPAREVCPVHLGSLLETALQSTAGEPDPYVGEVGFTLKRESVFSQASWLAGAWEEVEERGAPGDEGLSGTEAFALDLRPSRPASLLLTRKSVACYQMVFRQLFKSKLAERRLLEGGGPPRGSADARRSALRHKALCFVRGLEYAMTSDALVGAWAGFEPAARAAADLDALLAAHDRLLESCLAAALLAEPPLLLAHHRLLAAAAAAASPPASAVTSLDALFHRRAAALLAAAPKLSLRVDFNGFYAETTTYLQPTPPPSPRTP